MNIIQQKFKKTYLVEPDFRKLETIGDFKDYIQTYGANILHENICDSLAGMWSVLYNSNLKNEDDIELLKKETNSQIRMVYKRKICHMEDSVHLIYQFNSYSRNFINGYPINEVIDKLISQPANTLAYAYGLALAAEYYSTKAKKFHKLSFYDEKSTYLEKLTDICHTNKYVCGFTHSNIYRVPYITYFDLPHCQQISFHSTRQFSLKKYQNHWDGKVNSTFPKLYNAIYSQCSELFPVIESDRILNFYFPTLSEMHDALENVGTLRKFHKEHPESQIFFDKLFNGFVYGLKNILHKSVFNDDTTFEDIVEYKKQKDIEAQEKARIEREKREYEIQHYDEIQRSKIHTTPAIFRRETYCEGIGITRIKLLLNRISKKQEKFLVYRKALECIDSYNNAYYDNSDYRGKMFAKYHSDILELCQVAKKYKYKIRVYKQLTNERRFKIHPFVIIDIPGIRLCFEDLFFDNKVDECTKRCLPEDTGYGQIYRLETLILEKFKDEIDKMKK